MAAGGASVPGNGQWKEIPRPVPQPKLPRSPADSAPGQLEPEWPPAVGAGSWPGLSAGLGRGRRNPTCPPRVRHPHQHSPGTRDPDLPTRGGSGVRPTSPSTSWSLAGPGLAKALEGRTPRPAQSGDRERRSLWRKQPQAQLVPSQVLNLTGSEATTGGLCSVPSQGLWEGKRPDRATRTASPRPAKGTGQASPWPREGRTDDTGQESGLK